VELEKSLLKPAQRCGQGVLAREVNDVAHSLNAVSIRPETDRMSDLDLAASHLDRFAHKMIFLR
jgi:hypothetical protein